MISHEYELKVGAVLDELKNDDQELTLAAIKKALDLSRKVIKAKDAIHWKYYVYISAIDP